eukprot:1149518-Pelagomonas_calceolata.AAC.3
MQGVCMRGTCGAPQAHEVMLKHTQRCSRSLLSTVNMGTWKYGMQMHPICGKVSEDIHSELTWLDGQNRSNVTCIYVVHDEAIAVLYGDPVKRPEQMLVNSSKHLPPIRASMRLLFTPMRVACPHTAVGVAAA